MSESDVQQRDAMWRTYNRWCRWCSRGWGSSASPLRGDKVDHVSVVSESLRDSGVDVGLGFSEPTAIVTSDRDEGCSTLASVKGTATKGTLRIGGAWSGNELGALSTLETAEGASAKGNVSCGDDCGELCE